MSSLPSCLAWRDKGHLWYLVNFPEPTYATLPCPPATTPLSLQPGHDAEVAISWWTYQKPYGPFAPVVGGSPGLRCVLRRGIKDSDIKVSLLNGWYGASPPLRSNGQWVVDNIAAAMSALEGLYGVVCEPPPIPEIPERYNHNSDVVSDNICRFRQQCRDSIAYIRFVLSKHKPLDQPLPSNIQTFISTITQLKYEGIAFDPLQANPPSEQDIEFWTRLKIPFAYVWSYRHANSDQVWRFSPQHPDAPWRLEDSDQPPPQRWIAVEKRGNTEGIRLCPLDVRLCEEAYDHEEFYDDFLRLHYCVFFLDSPVKNLAKAVEFSSLYCADGAGPEYLGEIYQYPRMDRVPQAGKQISPSTLASTARAQEALTPGIHPNSSTPPTLTMPPTSATPSEFTVPSFRTPSNFGTSPTMNIPPTLASSEIPCPPDCPPSLPADNFESRRQRLLSYFVKKAIENQWFNIDRCSPNILRDVEICCRSDFLDHCTLSYPLITEARVLYNGLVGQSVSKVDLVILCLRNGLPFRLAFPDGFDRQYEQMNRNKLGRDVAGGWGWRTGVPETTLKPARLCAPPSSTSIKQYMDAVGRITLYPHFMRVLTYGGLSWRLAIEYGGASLAGALVEAPSLAWSLYGIAPPGDPRTGLRSESYESPALDDFTLVLHGAFSDGRSMWPLFDVFMDHPTWRGEWTRENELWFKQRKTDVERGTASPLSQKEWRRRLNNPSGAARRRGSNDPIARQLSKIVWELHCDGLFVDSFVGRSGPLGAD